MIRCILSLDYGALRYDKMTPEFVANWNEQCDALGLADWAITEKDLAKKDDPDRQTYDTYKSGRDQTKHLSYEQMCLVGAMDGVKVKFHPDESSTIIKLEERVRALSLRMGELERPAALAAGAAAIIHVPDQSLLYVDEVTYLEDSCTDRLQDHLDDGWRILAVCPPCSQRRPDYILGRRKSLKPLPLAHVGEADKPF